VPGRNRAPIISGVPVLSVNAHSVYQFTATAVDPDGSEITFELTNNPAWLSINPQTGVVTGTPSEQDIGSAVDIIVTAFDSGGKSDELAPFDIIVEQITEENLVADTLQSEGELAEQLSVIGIQGVVVERSEDYDAAISELETVPTSLIELQLVVDATNERFNTIDQAIIEVGLAPEDNTILLEHLATAQIENTVNENADAYRAPS